MSRCPTRDSSLSAALQQMTSDFDDATVSLRHAEIHLENGFAVLRDLQSTNGTRVNGILVDEIQLENASRIRFGGVEAVYESHPTDGAKHAEAVSHGGKPSAWSKRWIFAGAGMLLPVVGGMVAEQWLKPVTQPPPAHVEGLTESHNVAPEREHKATTFQDLVAAFFAPHRKTLAGDIQGFQFGSDVNAVVQNFEAQYQQKLDPTMTKTAAFLPSTPPFRVCQASQPRT